MDTNIHLVGIQEREKAEKEGENEKIKNIIREKIPKLENLSHQAEMGQQRENKQK